MATLKHIASKNSDYTAIEAYLVYQHDEFSGKVILDEQGKPKLRDSYLLDGKAFPQKRRQRIERSRSSMSWRLEPS